MYINDNIPFQEDVNLPNLEVIVTEFYQNNQKRLLLGLYKPPNWKTSNFIQNLSLILDLHFKNYDNVTLNGDCNDVSFKSFLQAYNLTSLIKEATCFQSGNLCYIDLILTNQKNMYKLSNTFETGISDHHKLISTVAKSGSFKESLQEKIYRSYRSFNIEIFKKTLSDKLCRLESNSLKSKFVRHNNNPLMTKELRKAIMKRSQLKNRYNKNRNYENWYLHKKQSNFCVSLLRKTKRNYFKNVKIENMTHNKKFWKTIEPCFSDKGYNQTKMAIIKKNSIIITEKKNCNSNK